MSARMSIISQLAYKHSFANIKITQLLAAANVQTSKYQGYCVSLQAFSKQTRIVFFTKIAVLSVAYTGRVLYPSLKSLSCAVNFWLKALLAMATIFSS